jgi:hypothetical protein
MVQDVRATINSWELAREHEARNPSGDGVLLNHADRRVYRRDVCCDDHAWDPPSGTGDMICVRDQPLL